MAFAAPAALAAALAALRVGDRPAWRVRETRRAVVPDEPGAIAAAVRGWCDDDRVDLVLTTGGTGFAPRDVTPEAVAPLLTRRAADPSEANGLSVLARRGLTRRALSIVRVEAQESCPDGSEPDRSLQGLWRGCRRPPSCEQARSRQHGRS